MSWLRLVTGLGLGACLADDMGLGKTVQVIGLLLHRKSIRTTHEPDRARSSLLVVPASLLANWKAELDRFAPTLSFLIAHPSENTTSKRQIEEQDAQGLDLLITTGGGGRGGGGGLGGDGGWEEGWIAEKSSLAGEVIDGAETLLTEMSNAELLDFVKLDIHKALDT